MTVADLEALELGRLGLAADADRAAIDAARLARLAAALERARRDAPFWRCHPAWPERGLREASDLAAFPFSTPADLAAGDPTFVAVSGGAVDRIVTLPTSGTTGPPKRVHFSADDVEATVAFFGAGMSIFTRPGDRVAIAFPGTRAGGVADGLAAAVRRLGATPVVVPADAGPAAVAALLRCERPDVIAGPPVRLVAAAAAAGDGGGAIPIRAALVSSDRAASALKARLAALFACEVFDHWGMTETGFGGAVECDRHDGLHLRESDLFVEIVDPATGQALPAGVPGEIVVTTLQPRAMPLVRYRTGDRARLVEAPCACGCRLARLVGPIGRIDDAVEVAPGAFVSLADVDEAVFGIDGVRDVAVDFLPGRLTVRVDAPEAKADDAFARRVEAALGTLPSLAAARAARAARLVVEVGPIAFAVGGGKRRIRRGGGA